MQRRLRPAEPRRRIRHRRHEPDQPDLRDHRDLSPMERHLSELLTAARAHGFVPMREDGERLVAEGITALEEVLRVTRD